MHDVRLVAVSDGVDSDEGEDDFPHYKKGEIFPTIKKIPT